MVPQSTQVQPRLSYTQLSATKNKLLVLILPKLGFTLVSY